MQEQFVNLNGNAGAFTPIPAPMATRYFTVREDEAGAATQGLQAQFPDDGFTQTYTYGPPGSPDQPQISRGHIAMNHGKGPVLGYPQYSSGGQTRPADVLIKLRSKSATATTVRIVFFD